MSSTIFADTRAPSDGALCALDVDGVLETGELGFPALAPVAALALRALARHGWRAVIVTGRSAEEVRSRCAAYPLAGGVAEYGAVVVDATSASTSTLLSDAEAADMRDLRKRVAALSGVFVDPAFGSVVRAYRLDGDRRAGLSEAEIAAVASGDANVEPVRGRSQTDLRPSGVDKALGARALAMALGATSDRPLGFAVGDSASDLAMFALAERAYVPSNAAELRSPTVRVTGAPYAAGFARAVATELGHAPGACAVCAPPALSSEAALLLGALAPQGQGRIGKLHATAALLARAARL
jgi:hydroxymethylpyrimidine pyrophosphatase-like HAD family hydrolase